MSLSKSPLQTNSVEDISLSSNISSLLKSIPTLIFTPPAEQISQDSTLEDEI